MHDLREKCSHCIEFDNFQVIKILTMLTSCQLNRAEYHSDSIVSTFNLVVNFASRFCRYSPTTNCLQK